MSANELTALRYASSTTMRQMQARGLHGQRTVRDSKYRVLSLNTRSWTALHQTLQDRGASDSRGFPCVVERHVALA